MPPLDIDIIYYITYYSAQRDLDLDPPPVAGAGANLTKKNANDIWHETQFDYCLEFGRVHVSC